jgi:formiminoglutamate deiminase
VLPGACRIITGVGHRDDVQAAGAPIPEAMTTLHFRNALLPGGWARDVRVRVDARGHIAAVDTGCPSSAASAEVVVPGLPNLHSHLFQRAMAGLTEGGESGQGFWSWRDRMYRFLAHLQPEQVRAVAAQACVEMIEAGFTHVVEFHYLHHDPRGRPYADPAAMAAAVLDAATEAGIGITLLPTLYAHSDFAGAPPLPEQRRFVNDVDAYLRLAEATAEHARSAPGASVGFALHSLRAVTPAQIATVAAEARDAPLHMHVAEQEREVAACLAWSGTRPVRWLLDHAPVNERWCLVHATHVDGVECEALARSGAVAGLCPITEANLGDGVFPATDFVAAGGHLGVGSDCNVEIGAAEELRLLEYGQRLRDRTRNRLAAGGARALLDAALAGGAQAAGIAAGRIAVGARADLVALDPEHPSLTGRAGDDWLDSWVFSAGREAVRDVWVGGRHRVAQGRHRARERVAHRYRDTLSRLLRDT